MDKKIESSIDYLAKKTGYEHTESLRFLHNLVKHVDPYCVLELGTAFGASAAYMASALGNGSSILISVDNYDGRNANSPNEIKTDMEKLGYEDRVVLVKGNTHNTRALLERDKLFVSPEILFMDADHSYKGLTKEFNSCAPFLAENHIIIVDDVITAAKHGAATFVSEKMLKYMYTVTIGAFHNGVALLCTCPEYFSGINAAIEETLYG